MNDLLGTHEVAELANVTVAAVANWRARGLITPHACLKCGPIYLASDVKHFLATSGRTETPKSAAREAYATIDQVRAMVRAELRILAYNVSPVLEGSKLAKPKRKLAGDGRGNGVGEYDWFFQLSSSERAHLSRKYLTLGGLSPDQWAMDHADYLGTSDVNEAMVQWVDATRLVDMCLNLAAGRKVKNPVHFTSPSGYNVARLFSDGGVEYLAEVIEMEQDRATELNRYDYTVVSDYEEMEVF